MAQQGGSFIPGGQFDTDNTSDNSQEELEERLTLLKGIPWGWVIGAVIIIGGYVGALYAIEFFVLDKQIARLRDQRAQIEAENSDIWPETSSVPTFLASAGQLSRTQTDVTSLLAFVRESDDLDIKPGSIFYTRDANVIEMQASVPSLQALNEVQQRLEDNRRITTVQIPSITQTENEQREFTLRLVFQ
ncbi:MAG: hypothetical protein ABEI13_00885 [Candidatus Paceibacteria bacterium]